MPSPLLPPFLILPPPVHPTPCLQLAALYGKFSGLFADYEERRSERMERMKSEVRVPVCVCWG